MESGAGVVYF